SLAVDPPTCQVPAAGGTSIHQLVNSGACRVAFKVRSSNNNDYRLKPVFGFIEPSSSAKFDITRKPGPPKEDKMVIQFVEAPADATDAQGAFKDGKNVGSVTLPCSAT
ncbi:UNVERIFIED_CONTAM: Sperm-specific class P protein 19, partial [Eudyptes robustus]